MPLDVKMPKLSDNMEAGTIVRWFKQVGDEVRVGESLAEIETDKADVELESEDGGTILEILVAEGVSAPVGGVIARLTVDGEAATAAGSSGPRDDVSEVENEGAPLDAESSRAAESSSPPAVRAEAPAVSARQTDARQPADAQYAAGPGLPQDHDHPAGPRQPGRLGTTDGAVRASPLAWRLAEEASISLGGLRGSGPGGRILKRDVETAKAQRTASAAKGDASAARSEEPSEASQAQDGDGNRIEPVSRMRSTIARRMTQAKHDIPHFYVKVAVDMTECMRLRQSIKQSGAMPALTVTHMIVKAVALALGRHPRLNASWREDGTVEVHAQRNIGIAVAVDDGLVVPVLHGTEQAPLAEIAAQAKQLTERARSGKFSGKDLSGSTISISNVGILDVDELVAVINPPHAAVLAVASVKERPIVRAGRLEVAKTMNATLSCDHRVLNGVEGAAFLEDLKRVLENPVVLLLQ